MKDGQKAQVLALVRKMISKNTENKEIGNKVEETTHNSPIGPADCYRILPDIAEGSTGNERLGDRIKPVSLQVRGVVSVNPADNPDTKAMYVRVCILSQKDIKNSSQIAAGAVDTAHLLRPALSGLEEIPFAGNRFELNHPINDNKFKVFMDKKYLIAPVSAASGNDQSRSQFVFNKTFKNLPASLTFDEGNGDTPNNFAPFLAIGYAYADGTAPDTVATRIKTSVYSRLVYEDA